MQLKISAAAFAVVAATTIAAFAHSGATGIVKKRMDAMGEMGKATEALTKIMRGQQEYDAGEVRAHAALIKSHAGNALTVMFPEGSNGHPSEARPDIWTDWDSFVELAQRLELFAGGLEAAAGNGPGMNGAAPAGDVGSMMGTSNGGMMMDGSSMMGGGMMEGDTPNAEMLAQMPANAVFGMMAQTCSACHTDFRVEKE